MKNRIVFYILCFIGVLCRFYYQFLIPSFNGDEISLGLNIKQLNYYQLLQPMRRGQSAPPLFLWLQKFISNLPIPNWIGFKLVSFFISILVLIVFLKFIKKKEYNIILLVPFTILLFNPYVIYHSLSLKQYPFDLLGIIVLITYFKSNKFKKAAPFFFLVWSFLSNVAIFACVGLLLFIFISHFYKSLKSLPNRIRVFLRVNYLLILSLFPYIFYFIWFMYQPGASGLKEYMRLYWSGSFMPFDSSFFKYWVFQLHGFWSYFYSMNIILAILLFLLSFNAFFYQLFKKEEIKFKNEIILCFCIFLVHLTLNIFHFYPLSDRLYLYLTIPFILLLASSLIFLVKKSRINSKIVSVTFSVILFSTYLSYISYKENDVKSVYNYIKAKNESSIYLTESTKKAIDNFNSFTDNYFIGNIHMYKLDDSFNKSNYLVSRVYNKMRPNKKHKESVKVLEFLKNNKIVLEVSLGGYNVYRILK
ncbi:hypothetical protein [uncultured Lacinutrix sp.]|uniref:hypothetical protein n=1 Tax=uncultured Lacinutrix sp. TaxID=574032 RepID=UPI0026308252|nr:hypothetical protein [uncultured Lacinutrix sp.]